MIEWTGMYKPFEGHPGTHNISKSFGPFRKIIVSVNK
jgi:hypothetical protein